MMSSFAGSAGRPLLRVLVGAVGVVLPDIALALTYLVTWLVPGAVGDDMVRTLVTTLLLEFFVIHSAAFMGVAAVAPFPRGIRAVIVTGLGVVYMVILWPMSQITGQSWLVWAFWGLVLNRLWALAAPAVASGLQSSQPVQDEWATTGIRYVCLAAVTSLLPMPALGLGGVLALQRPLGTGLWMEAPQHAMALGLFYFGGNAYARLRR